MDSRLKGISIESNNSHNRILTKELCKLQAMKKISNLQHLQQQQQHQPLFLVIFGCCIKSIWVDSRLNGISLESKNTQKGLRTKKLRPSEIRGHNQKIRCTEQAGAYCFLSFFGHNLSSSCIMLHMGGF